MSKEYHHFYSCETTESGSSSNDDEPKLAKDCVTYKPIHQEELKVLKKFGLDDIESGYFDCDDEDDYEDED